jgi:cell wall-associated protease
VTGDQYGHGTQVAALVAGNPADAAGIVGVAPDARVLPLRIGTADGRVSDKAAAAALAYAIADPRVRVISLSWETTYSPRLARALEAVERKRSVLLVAAAGNDGARLTGSLFLPERFDRPRVLLPQSLTGPSMLIVASSNLTDRLSSFSNYGPMVDVAAPGEGILSAFPGGTLKVADGTSLAAPIVSGVAALLFSRYPAATAAQVKQAIVSSCIPTTALHDLVGCDGIANAPRALDALTKIEKDAGDGYAAPPVR